MTRVALLLLLGAAACGKQSDVGSAHAVPKAAAASSVTAAQSMMGGKSPTEMQLIPIPKDKAQLGRLLAMGYTVHKDHMHPPGVKSCPLDKNGDGVVE
jgi:hypothetical protein